MVSAPSELVDSAAQVGWMRPLRPVPQRKIRRALRWAWIYLLHFSGLLKWARRRIIAQRGIVVLTLHRVLDDVEAAESCSLPGMIVRRTTYESLVRYLAHHCQPVRVSGKPPDWMTEPAAPRVALTFDDGWIDTARTALPIARRHGIDLTVFVCPNLVGQDAPFWPERVTACWRAAERSPQAWREFARVLAAVDGEENATARGNAGITLEKFIGRLKEMPSERRDRVIGQMTTQMTTTMSLQITPHGRASVDATMDWAEAAAAIEEGLQIGSHTQSHAILTTIPEPTVREELFESKRVIEEVLGKECSLLAYPNGNWSPEARKLAKQAGYGLAFINQRGVWTKDCDPFLIPRVNVWEGTLVGPSGAFSPLAFEYGVFWRSYRAGKIKANSSKSQTG